MTKKPPKYRHTPAEWKTLRADLRDQFLNQLEDCKNDKGHLPGTTTKAQTAERLKVIKAGLAEFDAELRRWWTLPSPRADDLQGILSRVTRAEVRYHRRIQSELGLELSPLLPGQLPGGWWERVSMNERVRRRFRKRMK
jgi:hypothetical protein